MLDFEEVKKYLPKYLSPESEKLLFQELKSYPANIDSRMYITSISEPNCIFQGDGIKDLLVLNLPNSTIKTASSMILSNTCDINPQNKRLYLCNIVYSPIFNLEKYQEGLIKRNIKNEESIKQHIDAIKSQYVTQIFYLPSSPNLDESIVFFDRVVSCNSNYVKTEKLNDIRLFKLSNYGLYLFIFKMSIHFSRITERLDRL